MDIKHRFIGFKLACFLVIAATSANAYEIVLTAKAGNLRSGKDVQPIEGNDHIDRNIYLSKEADAEYAIGVELRRPLERFVLAFGPEHISYKHRYSFRPSGEDAWAVSKIFLARVKLYNYALSPRFRPFVGIGAGNSYTDLTADDGYNSTYYVYSATLGFETLIGKAWGFVVQYEYIDNASNNRGDYDASVRGFFIGTRIGF